MNTTKFLRVDGDGTCSWQTIAGDIESVTAGTNLNGGGSSGDVTINLDTNITGDITFDTDTLAVDATNNRVGIGTASPAQKLHVNKTGLTVDTVNEIACIQGSSATTNTHLIISSGVSGSTVANRFIDLSSFDHNPTARALCLQKDGGNVGIGNSAPSTSLHVSGAFSSGSAPYIRSEDTTSTGALIEMYATQASGAGYVQTGASTDIRFAPAGSTKMLLEHTTGNLGLGTTAPNANS